MGRVRRPGQKTYSKNSWDATLGQKRGKTGFTTATEDAKDQRVSGLVDSGLQHGAVTCDL